MKQTLVLAVAVVCCVAVTYSQDGPNQFRAQQRVEQFKKLRMIEALKLDEETSVRFFAKYSKHEDALRGINKERNDLIDRLQEMRKSNADAAGMEKLFHELTALDSKQAEARQSFLEDIKSVLSTQQIADFIVFERDFARNIRQLMQEMARERRQGQR
ncbi:MAG TPA: hypothetical protein VI758_13960 [Bacteroidota bacterium]